MCVFRNATHRLLTECVFDSLKLVELYNLFIFIWRFAVIKPEFLKPFQLAFGVLLKIVNIKTRIWVENYHLCVIHDI